MTTPARSPAPSNEEIDDVRVVKLTPIASPALVLNDLPSDEEVRRRVRRNREEVDAIVTGRDARRVLCLVGPCSIHDVKSGITYAAKLNELARELEEDVKIVMRVYFEKPRTTVGWKGLINDPDLNGTFNINKGLKLAREFLLAVNRFEHLCAGCEFLDTITPQYLADLVCWGAIGARTTESQVHRELASGLSCAIGFKNGSGGDVQIAVDACLAAREPHSFLSVTKDGVVAVVHTKGNDACHVILRGGGSGTNFDAKSVGEAATLMTQRKLEPRLIVDCSHGNSQKNFHLQGVALKSVGEQIASRSETSRALRGAMLESNLCEGNQPLQPGKTPVASLKEGVSVTDGCISFETTERLLREFASEVRRGRGEETSPRKIPRSS